MLNINSVRICLHILFNLQKISESEGSEKSTNSLKPRDNKLFESRSPSTSNAKSGCSSRSSSISPPFKQLICNRRVHDDLIPASVRSIQRVHSCSVLQTDESKENSENAAFHIELFSSPESDKSDRDKVQSKNCG